MSRSSYDVKIPSELGTRLRALDRLSRRPQTLGEYGNLLQERMKRCLEEPDFRSRFEEIYEGKRIFGHVSYETRHTVQPVGGKQAHVACAIDAIVEGFFQPIEIDSTCFHCGEPIQFRMSKGIANPVRPSSSVIWLGTSKEGDGPCETYLCPYTNFFSSAEHVAEWKDENPNQLGIMITLQQGLELARKGYWEAIRSLRTET